MTKQQNNFKEVQSIFDKRKRSTQFTPRDQEVGINTVIYKEAYFWKYLALGLLFLLFLLLIFLLFFRNNNFISENSYFTQNDTYLTNQKGVIEGRNNQEISCVPGESRQLKLIHELFSIQNSGKDFMNESQSGSLKEKFVKYQNEIKQVDIGFLEQVGEEEISIKNINDSLKYIIGGKSSYLSNSKSLGVEVNDEDMSIIIPKNSQFPITQEKTYLTRNAYQKTMRFKIFTGESDKTVDNTYIGEYVIGDLQPIEEIGPRVKVAFEIEEDGKINFKAYDIKYPSNEIEEFLDTEVDILTRSDNNIELINSTFSELDENISSELRKMSQEPIVSNTLQRQEVEVLRVIDGDTISFLYNGNITSARLIGIDAPESSAYRYGFVEEFGNESSSYLKELVEGKNIEIEFDNTQGSTDIYGRLLIYIYLGDENINQKMIEEGYAKEFTYDKNYKFLDDFIIAQENAKTNRVGIWK